MDGPLATNTLIVLFTLCVNLCLTFFGKQFLWTQNRFERKLMTKFIFEHRKAVQQGSVDHMALQTRAETNIQNPNE